MKNDVEVVVGIVSSECPICLEEFPSLQEELCGLSCGCQFCHQCLTAHVKEKISNGIIEVSCLNTVCNGIMTHEEIHTFCEDGYQQRIMNLRKSLEVARDKYFTCVHHCISENNFYVLRNFAFLNYQLL